MSARMLAALFALFAAASEARAGVFDFCKGTSQTLIGDGFGSLFSAYKDNYFITGFHDGESLDQVKFQLSVKFDVIPRPDSQCSVFFGYTQKSFWRLYAGSAPFEDNNYNPDLFWAWTPVDSSRLRKPQGGSDWRFVYLHVGAEHESNGRGDVEIDPVTLQPTAPSRGWNRVYARARWEVPLPQEWSFFITPKGWIPFLGLDGNPELLHYVGSFQLTLELSHETAAKDGLRSTDFSLGAAARKGWSRDPGKGSIEAWARFRVGCLGPLSISLYAQYYVGYGEGLLHYRESSNVLRIGFATDDRAAWNTTGPTLTTLAAR